MFAPLTEELTFPITPWQAFQALVDRPGVLFLDSSLPHPTLGRYSYLSAEPFLLLQGKGSRYQALWGDGSASAVATNPFELLRRSLESYHLTTVPGLPPFQGGAAGLFGYDLCHQIERLPRPRFDDIPTPDLAVGLYDWVLAYDHVEQRCWLVSTGFPETEPSRRRRRAEERLRWARERITDRGERVRERANGRKSPSAPSLSPAPNWSMPQLPGLLSNFRREDLLRTIQRAIDYVHAGDCFQVNLAQRLLYPQRESPVALFRKSRERNPSPFGGYFDLGDFVIVSASPERFLRLDPGGQVETRPIKGTRPRGALPAEDQRNREELENSAKDRAENVMIVDLLRNDLGCVCAYGSIAVPQLCQVESYRTVHHLVSSVVGRLRPDRDAIDLLQAAFPGGSVTGAPKVRAMEIISELEPTARGPYCGSLGFLGFDGVMDTNILIRTFTVGHGWVQFPVGGGIVADSDPEHEYEETLHKAEGLLRALC